jgi:hypothetical protein
MKGVVFTEFLEMAEARFSLRVVDQVITVASPASGGVYTSVGTYPHQELVALLMELSRQTSIGPADLLKEFGAHLLQRFVETQPAFFAAAADAFALLKSVEGHIHVEVRKLYPDAELPSIVCSDDGPGRLILVYRSPRGLADLAEGLITGCAKHYGEVLTLQRDDLSAGKGEVVRFTLSRRTDP